MPPKNMKRYVVRLSENWVFGRVAFLLNLYRIAFAMSFSKTEFELKDPTEYLRSEWVDCEVWTDQPLEMFKQLRTSFNKHPELVTVYRNSKNPSNEINIWQLA